MKVTIIGQGQPVLYLHGWGFDSQVWNRQVDFFRSRYANWLVDYNLAPAPADLTRENFFDRLCAPLLKRCADAGKPPAAVLANGLGAFLAYELIERGLAPERLVLCGGLLRFTNDEHYGSGVASQRVAAMRQALAANPRRMLSAYYHFVFSGRGEEPPRDLMECMPLNAVEFLRLAFDVLISYDFQELVPTLRLRTLVVHGEDDKASPIWQGQLLGKLLPDAALHRCKGAGHLPFVTHYAAVNRLIAQFIEGGALDALP
ncbi:MAG: alpha/beta hydrolase [Candidatus Lambdaproteobacteria bacterium]|nr:alpha/beta hydrolase [Candidatus Lambdaproteobacteria bacterium]